ncbi:hypothetical protein NKG05_14620 [Oerskovia sp. M15]
MTALVIAVAAPWLASLLGVPAEQTAQFVEFARWMAVASALTVPTTIAAAALRGWGRPGCPPSCRCSRPWSRWAGSGSWARWAASGDVRPDRHGGVRGDRHGDRVVPPAAHGLVRGPRPAAPAGTRRPPRSRSPPRSRRPQVRLPDPASTSVVSSWGSACPWACRTSC